MCFFFVYSYETVSSIGKGSKVKICNPLNLNKDKNKFELPGPGAYNISESFLCNF